MDSLGQRLYLNIIVAIGCVVLGLNTDDRTPTRDVTEMVSVVYKPARIVPADPPGTVEVARADPPVQAPEGVQSANPTVVAAAREVAVASPATRPAANIKGVTRVSCRGPACAGQAYSDKPRKSPGRHVARQETPRRDPKLPDVLVPIRKLGLYLQARTAGPVKQSALQ